MMRTMRRSRSSGGTDATDAGHIARDVRGKDTYLRAATHVKTTRRPLNL